MLAANITKAEFRVTFPSSALSLYDFKIFYLNLSYIKHYYVLNSLFCHDDVDMDRIFFLRCYW